MAMQEFLWKTQVGSSGNTAFAVTKNEFDGYVQRVSTGINNKKRQWNLSFIGDDDEIPLVKDFIDNHKGTDPFLWQIPGSTGKIMVTCEGYGNTYNGFTVETLTFVFEEFLSPQNIGG